MEQEPPTWLDDRFLEAVLQGGPDKEPRVTVAKFSTKKAVAAGNNYTSNILRVHVEYTLGTSSELKSVSLIAKIPTLSPDLKEFSEEVGFLDKEPKIYKEVLPIMQEKIKHEFGPKSFYSPFKNILILSDLKSEGYAMMDRFEQLDFSHCKFVFETLAKYHAASVACHHDNPDVIEQIGKEIVYIKDSDVESIKQMKLWIEFAAKNFADIISGMNGLKTVADLIASKVGTIWESITDICQPQARLLNVLNHGDCWTNNIMFKHNDSGEVVDVKFLDFQIPRYGLPTIDLFYFMWGCAKEEVRENSQQELYDTYLKTLNETLKKLGCEERLTSEELKEHLISSGDWIIFAMSFLLPFTLCETENVIDFGKCSLEDFKSGEVNKKFQKMQSSKRFREKIPALARQYHSWMSSMASPS